jgi:hypothetical protein
MRSVVIGMKALEDLRKLMHYERTTWDDVESAILTTIVKSALGTRFIHHSSSATPPSRSLVTDVLASSTLMRIHPCGSCSKKLWLARETSQLPKRNPVPCKQPHDHLQGLVQDDASTCFSVLLHSPWKMMVATVSEPVGHLPVRPDEI